MSEKTIHVTRKTARRFLVNALGLDSFQAIPDVATAIDRLGFVQEDSINICGRMHDLILWPRVADYSPAALHAALYDSPRRAFEYPFPNLCALPMADLPYFRRAMAARATTLGRWHALLPDELPIAERILAEIEANGPLRSRATGTADGHSVSAWGTRTTVSSHVIEKLWLHGRLMVAYRQNFERFYDHAERHLPVGEADLPDLADERRYLARKRLRARRLFRPRKDDLATLGVGACIAVTFEGARRPYYALADDVDALRAAAEVSEPSEVHLLAPLDPLVYDRDRNRELWDFDYTWEVYTPAVKRQWGYYVLPILAGDRLVGRVDPKMDRKTRTLTLQSLTLEPGVTWSALAPGLARRLSGYARFLGATTVNLPTGTPAALRRRLEKYLG
jgi:uncharacterized protein YcaQ